MMKMENNNLLNSNEIPQGLGMALAENMEAMQRFGGMGEKERQSFVNRSRSVNSKQEMRSLVSELSQMK